MGLVRYDGELKRYVPITRRPLVSEAISAQRAARCEKCPECGGVIRSEFVLLVRCRPCGCGGVDLLALEDRCPRER